jgi:hypothetical protein
MLLTLQLEKAGLRRIEILKESWECKDVSRSASNSVFWAIIKSATKRLG